jgi:hypothetical protein
MDDQIYDLKQIGLFDPLDAKKGIENTLAYTDSCHLKKPETLHWS